MKSFETYFPTKIIFGAGKIKEVGQHCATLGKKAFGVFDPFLKDGEVIKRVRESMKANGVGLVEFYDVVPNPRYTTMDKGAAICKEEGCDCIITIGGGSAIDTAKAIGLAVVFGGSCWDFTEKYAEPENVVRPSTKGLPLLCVPTTAGTGSEATLAAVVNNPERKLKCAIVNPVIYPNISIIDPEIMYSIPAMLTALTGIDTFAHAFESYINVSSSEWSEMLSLKSIELFVRSIRTAVKEPKNEEGRSDMALASALGGAAFCQCGLGLPHAMGQPVSGLSDAPHGATLAICLPPIIEWTLPNAEEKIAKVAEMFDPSISGLSVSEKAKKLIPLLKKLYDDLGVHVTYKDYGVKEEDIEVLASMVFDHFQWDVNGHPKAVTREDVIELYKKCL